MTDANQPGFVQRTIIAALCVTLPAVLGWGALGLMFRFWPEAELPDSAVITPNPAKAPEAFRGDPAVEVLMDYDPRLAFRASHWKPILVAGCLLWLATVPWIFRHGARSRLWLTITSSLLGLVLAWPWLLSWLVVCCLHR